MNLARFTRVYSATYSSIGNVHDLIHSVISQNKTPHFGIANLLLPTAQQKQQPHVLFSQFGLNLDIVTMDERL